VGPREKGDLKPRRKGGGGGSKDKQGGDPSGRARRTFASTRLDAPVPVPRPTPRRASDRLRRIATEIAQKIVEKVRVGHQRRRQDGVPDRLSQRRALRPVVKVSAKNER